MILYALVYHILQFCAKLFVKKVRGAAVFHQNFPPRGRIPHAAANPLYPVPRACGADRAAGQTGLCGAGDTLRAARAALHHWEEPCLSGDPEAPTGSGTVFFSGCALGCCYCQNYGISQEGQGRPLTEARLAEIFLELQTKGARNINLVTATQWLPWVLPALDSARRRGLRLPVVYNTGGYETVQTVQALAGYVDIWLTDFKYDSPALAAELSRAGNYPAVADRALRAMLRQTGAPYRPRRVFAPRGHCAASGAAWPGGGQPGRAAAAGHGAPAGRGSLPFEPDEPVHPLLPRRRSRAGAADHQL